VCDSDRGVSYAYVYICMLPRAEGVHTDTVEEYGNNRDIRRGYSTVTDEAKQAAADTVGCQLICNTINSISGSWTGTDCTINSCCISRLVAESVIIHNAISHSNERLTR